MNVRLSASVIGLAALVVLTGCGGHHGSRPPGVITGIIQIVGGPPPGNPRGFPGFVMATGADGRRFMTRARPSGHFRLSLPPGSYRVTGSSPMGCTGHDVRVETAGLVTGIRVACSVP